MPVTPARSQSINAIQDEAFAVPVGRRRPPARARSTVRRRGLVPLHLAAEVLFGVALAVVPAVTGVALGVCVLAAIMGVLITVTAVSAPATGLPLRGSRLHDRMGIDALLVGLAAMLWVVGEAGGDLLAAAAAGHAGLSVLPGRVRARR
jgi:hypothetical protein